MGIFHWVPVIAAIVLAAVVGTLAWRCRAESESFVHATGRLEDA
jgi:hypothetical protein